MERRSIYCSRHPSCLWSFIQHSFSILCPSTFLVQVPSPLQFFYHPPAPGLCRMQIEGASGVEVLLAFRLPLGPPFVGTQGHAVAEAPTGVARALLYIVRGSPSFLLSFLIHHQSYKLFYHTFHQVMSPGRRAYSLKSILLYCILLRSFTSYHHKFAARKSLNDKIY